MVNGGPDDRLHFYRRSAKDHIRLSPDDTIDAGETCTCSLMDVNFVWFKNGSFWNRGC